VKYVDASAVLRILFGEPGPSVPRSAGDRIVSSQLLEVLGVLDTRSAPGHGHLVAWALRPRSGRPNRYGSNRNKYGTVSRGIEPTVHAAGSSGLTAQRDSGIDSGSAAARKIARHGDEQHNRNDCRSECYEIDRCYAEQRRAS